MSPDRWTAVNNKEDKRAVFAIVSTLQSLPGDNSG
jgi:hypothetical protein